MPPTQQASKVNGHMMFTPHQSPFIDLLLITISAINATLRKRQQGELYLGADREFTVGELALVFTVLLSQAVDHDLNPHQRFQTTESVHYIPCELHMDNRYGCLKKILHHSEKLVKNWLKGLKSAPSNVQVGNEGNDFLGN